MQLQARKERQAIDIKSRLALLQMSTGYWISQSLYAAAKLGIADLLMDEAKTCDELASATNTNARALYRLMRGLASVGVFAEEGGHFVLTPISQGLRSDIPESMRDSILLAGEEYYRAWGNLLYSLETGNSAFEREFGMPLFDYYSQHEESGAIFNRAMQNISRAIVPVVVNSYDFSKTVKLVDVGGGNGSSLGAILKANPQLQGIVFDLETAVAKASSVLEKNAVSDRATVVAGNFFESVPSGADTYLLKYVLHNWDDEKAIAILRNCYDAMSDSGKILVVEQVIPPGNEPFSAKLIDLQMLVMTSSGCERTAAEYQSLFEAAGFELVKIIPTRSNVSILEGVRK